MRAWFINVSARIKTSPTFHTQYGKMSEKFEGSCNRSSVETDHTERKA